MSDLVQIKPAGALTVAGEGLEDFYLKPAQLKLVQNTTTDEGAVKGKLFDTLSKSNYESMQVVPLAIRMGRVLFPPGGELGAEPLCRSNDGVVPAPDAQAPQSPKCATCDFGPKNWANYRTTGKKPDCQEKAKMLFIDRESGLPYWITIGGKSISQLKALKAAIFREAIKLKNKGEPVGIYDFTFLMKPIMVQGRKGSYYELVFTELRRIQNVGEFGPMYETYVKRVQAEQPEVADEAVDQEFDSATNVEV